MQIKMALVIIPDLQHCVLLARCWHFVQTHLLWHHKWKYLAKYRFRIELEDHKLNDPPTADILDCKPLAQTLMEVGGMPIPARLSRSLPHGRVYLLSHLLVITEDPVSRNWFTGVGWGQCLTCCGLSSAGTVSTQLPRKANQTSHITGLVTVLFDRLDLKLSLFLSKCPCSSLSQLPGPHAPNFSKHNRKHRKQISISYWQHKQKSHHLLNATTCWEIR